ncbi:MAG TPA: hypothetical protein VEU76_03335 [Candidatus Udaeobacter sp.]|nr:hypothetical protein [Candidatus Udaeobacter sp.]
MTRLLDPAIVATVTVGPGGAPVAISGAYTGSLDPIARWKVETAWWKTPVVREYWRVVLNNNILCELYRDVANNEWYVDRIYD